jgi:hypothetical protein
LAYAKGENVMSKTRRKTAVSLLLLLLLLLMMGEDENSVGRRTGDAPVAAFVGVVI